MGDTAKAAWKSTCRCRRWDTRARQRFSVLQTVATGTVARNSTVHPASGHAPFLDDTTPNPRYWRDLEEKLAYANDHGLIILLTGLGNSPAGFGAQQRAPAFARYIVAASPPTWCSSPSWTSHRPQTRAEAAARATPLVTQHP